jgi:hypothetical protein
MSSIEKVYEDLRTLTPDKLEVAAEFVHRLAWLSEQERRAIFTRTAGALSPVDADELKREIESGCERVDEQSW